MTKVVFMGLVVSTLCVPPVLAVVAAPLPAEGPRLVLYPPWVDGVDIVKRAGGDPVGPSQAPMGVLAFAPDSDAFDQRLRSAGAWAVLDGAAIAALCGLEVKDVSKGTRL